VNLKTTLKSTVAVAALFAVAAPVANAADDTLSSGNKNTLKISGQVVRSIFHADDGVSSKTFQGSGNWTASRVRWIASGKLNENVTVGAGIEMNIPLSNTSGSATMGTQQADGANQSSSGWAIRHQYVWTKHKKFGKLSMGNTNSAANGTSEADLSGVGIFAGSDGDSYGSGIFFQNTATASAPTASTVTVGAALDNLDGTSRTDVIRYDSPNFMGVTLATSAIAGGEWDVALRYGGKFGSVKVKAAAGYTNLNQTNGSANFTASGSVALLHDSGLNVAFAMGKRNFAGGGSKSSGGISDSPALGIDTNFNGTEDPHFMYVGVGFKAKPFGVGGTNFVVKWNQTNDFVQLANHDGNEAESTGIAVQQSFSAIGATVGLEYMNYSYESKSNTTANTFDDIDVIALMTVFAF
jgi:hypothetical protein